MNALAFDVRNLPPQILDLKKGARPAGKLNIRRNHEHPRVLAPTDFSEYDIKFLHCTKFQIKGDK
jgi:hypothetical protein